MSEPKYKVVSGNMSAGASGPSVEKLINDAAELGFVPTGITSAFWPGQGVIVTALLERKRRKE